MPENSLLTCPLTAHLPAGTSAPGCSSGPEAEGDEGGWEEGEGEGRKKKGEGSAA